MEGEEGEETKTSKQTTRLKLLEEQMDKHMDPGFWIVGLDTDTVTTRFSYSLSTAWAPSQKGIEASLAFSEPSGETGYEKFMSVLMKARWMDRWDRGIHARTLLTALIHLFSLDVDGEKKEFSTGTKPLSPAVEVVGARATGFKENAMRSVKLDFDDIEALIPELDESAYSLHFATTCHKIVIVDMRGGEVQEQSRRVRLELEMPELPSPMAW